MTIRWRRQAWNLGAALLVMFASVGGWANERASRASWDGALGDSSGNATGADGGWSVLPFKKERKGGAWEEGGVATLLLGTLVVVGLAVGLARRRPGWVTRAGAWRSAFPGWLGAAANGNDGGRLRVKQSTRLTQEASLHVVEWQGKELLVGCTGHGLRVLERRLVKSEGPEEGGA